MKVEILMTPGCGNGARTQALVTEVAGACAPGAEVVSVQVASMEDAERLAFPGSPTVRVDGLDVDPGPPPGVGLG